ncbi:copper chaperone PCu(A)C [Kitasatospora sp. NPDC059646]|uniref:copper chaperone PCu(A)C n=1 Tax=Kitasatospora sp. NPDC059646 TaxID=3346893 RepID=UPI0036CDC3E2
MPAMPITAAPGRRLPRLRRLVVAATAGAISLSALVACGADDPSPASDQGSPKAAVAAVTEPVTVKDPWVKASDSGMTGVFGTLVNTTGAPLTVVSGTSTVSAKTELHEVADVDGKPAMRPKAGGFVVPPGAGHELKPGADHIMLMGLNQPLKPGDEATVTLTLDDGRTVKFAAVAKAFAGGKEDYTPGMAKG